MSSSTSRSSFLVVNQRGKRGRPGFGATKGTATGDRRVYPGVGAACYSSSTTRRTTWRLSCARAAACAAKHAEVISPPQPMPARLTAAHAAYKKTML